MIEQGSLEWMQIRLGKATASRIADIMATTKSGPSASRQNYLAQLVAERLTGTVQESFTNAAMQWGTDNEPVARAMYEVQTGFMVDQVGFVDHPTIPMSGASPDGLIDLDGLVEIKCPNTATHIETLIAKSAPSKYIKQMQWQIACTGRQWCDFASYDPRMPDRLALFVVRVHRDDVLIAKMEAEVAAFLDDVEKTLKQLGDL
jgi:putative phage-type endonuclease